MEQHCAKTETPRPCDADNTGGLPETKIGALNDNFARLWPDWRLRGSKEVPDGEITRNLVHFVMRRQFAE